MRHQKFEVLPRVQRVSVGIYGSDEPLPNTLLVPV